MTNNRDPYTTASAAPENAAADFHLVEDGQSVDDLAAKIFRVQFVPTGQSYYTAHIQAVRLLNSAK